MWSFLYKNPRLLLLLILMIGGAGLTAFVMLPHSEDPRQKNRFSFIITEWPGANAARVETLVTEPVEQALLESENVRRFRSTSSAGMSVIQIELKQTVSDVHTAWSKIRDRMSEIAPGLPEGSSAPYVAETEEAAAYTMIVGVTWGVDEEVPYTILRRVALELEERIRFLRGTEYTRLFGAPGEEILVEAPEYALAQLGLSASTLSDAIAANDSKESAGRVRGASSEMSLEVTEVLDSVSRVAHVPVGVNADGIALLVGDLATVQRVTSDPPLELAFLDGEPGIAVAVRMETGERIEAWSARVREEVDAFSEEVSGNINVEVLLDQSVHVEASLLKLLRSVLLGMTCVVAVTLLMMGWRSALVVGLALPLCAMLVLWGMLLLDVTVHQISVTGLILSLGLLIDNAVIMVDEMGRRFRENAEKNKSITEACRHLLVPLLGSTVTTVLAFTPLLLLGGAEGDFVGPLGVTVALSLVSSFFVALFITPAVSAYLLHSADASGKSRWWRNGIGHPKLTSQYRSTIDGALSRPGFGIALALIFPVVGFAMLGSLEQQFFPPSERNEFRVQLKMPEQSSIARTVEGAREMERVIRTHAEVERVDVFVGSHLPRFFYNLMSWERQQPNIAHAVVTTDTQESVRGLVHALQAELDAALPEAQALVLELEQGAPLKAPIELRVAGSDLEVLDGLGSELRSILAAVPEVTHTAVSLSSGKPKLSLNVDEVAAQRAGVDPVTLARVLEGNLEGRVGGSIVEVTESIPIRVRSTAEDRSDIARIHSLHVLPEGSREVNAAIPLSALGEIALVPEFTSISHNDSERDNEVYGYLTAGVLPATVMKILKQRIEESGFVVPEGYVLEFGGEEETSGEAVEMLVAGVPLLLLLMFATLVFTFNSFRLAMLIAVVGFLSLGCAFTGLWLFDFPLGFMGIVGTLGLVGLAINDSIVVLAAIREHPGARACDPVAVRGVVVRSTRHILTTSLTTVAGFTPLFLGGGLFWPPLAVAIAGGVVGATLLALFFVPPAYLILGGRFRSLAQSEMSSSQAEFDVQSDGTAVARSAAKAVK